MGQIYCLFLFKLYASLRKGTIGVTCVNDEEVYGGIQQAWDYIRARVVKCPVLSRGPGTSTPPMCLSSSKIPFFPDRETDCFRRNTSRYRQNCCPPYFSS